MAFAKYIFGDLGCWSQFRPATGVWEMLLGRRNKETLNYIYPALPLSDVGTQTQFRGWENAV